LQWLCHDDSTINTVLVIIIVIIIITFPDRSEATPSPSGGTKASNIEPK